MFDDPCVLEKDSAGIDAQFWFDHIEGRVELNNNESWLKSIIPRIKNNMFYSLWNIYNYVRTCMSSNACT